MSKHFKKVHSDELRAAVIKMRQDNPKLAGSAIARMIRAGQVPGFPTPAHINDQTVREWIKKAEHDETRKDMNELQSLAREVFDTAKREIDTLKTESNPNNPRREGPRKQVDPAQLRKLLDTAADAWRIIEPPKRGRPFADKPEEPEEEPEPPVDPESESVLDAFDQ
jgi:hypothetical protein